MKARALLSLLVTLAGCTPETRWGQTAVYAPDLRAYVIARADPPTLAPAMPVGELELSRRIVLTNPITGTKIRCREELSRYLIPISREAATALADENTALEVTLPVVMTMPTSWPGALLLADVAAPLSAFPQTLRAALSAPSARSLYADGKRALEARRYAEAEALFERALAKSNGPFHASSGDGPERASYYLGALYQIDGRQRDAERAYLRFIQRADVRDARAYDDAERRLALIDSAALAPCRSQAPIRFAWPRQR